jgi:hypothetical protein
MKPDFSPAMLKSFLRIRVGHMAFSSAYPAASQRPLAYVKAEISAKRTLRIMARVTEVQFDLAWHGRALSVEPRLKLWGALGVVPAEYGIRLVDYGKQELSDAA